MMDDPNAGPDYVFPDKPAYGVPETVDYTKLNDVDLPDEPYSFEHEGDGPGFDNESELPESDYPEVGEDNDHDSV
jgi:hypothetical protein